MRIQDIDIVVIKGDITEINTEAIVNAANTNFEMGGGVALAIKKKGGTSIEKEAVEKGPGHIGAAVLTGAGKLKAKYVIHAVTMGMNFKTDEEAIRNAAYHTLLCAQDNNISSVAFCALGCGTGKFSPSDSAKIMAQEVFRYIHQIPVRSVKKIVFVAYSDRVYQAFSNNIGRYLNYMVKKISQGPFLTVDGIVEYNNGIIMIKRSNPPLGWALPGGFVDYGESLEHAAQREGKEETNLDIELISPFRAYSDPKRDKRTHTITFVFIAKGRGEPKGMDDAKQAKWFSVSEIKELNIAFDHKKIILDYLEYKKLLKEKALDFQTIGKYLLNG